VGAQRHGPPYLLFSTQNLVCLQLGPCSGGQLEPPLPWEGGHAHWSMLLPAYSLLRKDRHWCEHRTFPHLHGGCLLNRAARTDGPGPKWQLPGC
jgi:hypothetical protein